MSVFIFMSIVPSHQYYWLAVIIFKRNKEYFSIECLWLSGNTVCVLTTPLRLSKKTIQLPDLNQTRLAHYRFPALRSGHILIGSWRYLSLLWLAWMALWHSIVKGPNVFLLNVIGWRCILFTMSRNNCSSLNLLQKKNSFRNRGPLPRCFWRCL